MTIIDTSHLEALELNLSRERGRLSSAKTAQERELRSVWVRQLEKEVEAEKVFLGLAQTVDVEMSDEELLKELQG